MCLIASRETVGPHIPNAVIDSNFSRNPDGFGIAFRTDSGLIWQKFAPSEKKAFRKMLKEVDKTSAQYAAHWRLATHGPVCLDLSHPFSYIDSEGVENLVFHNGVISSIKTKQGESDTSAFVNRVLANLPPRWWENVATKWMVEQVIGWSRLLIMTPTESIYINEGEWKTEGGIRYSTNPMPYKPVQHSGKDTTNHYLHGGGEIDDYSDWKVTQDNSLLLPAGLSGDEDELDEDVIIAEGKHLFHLGHPVSIVTSETKGQEADDFGVIVCDTCDTSGEYYIIDGKKFIDLRHHVNMLANY